MYLIRELIFVNKHQHVSKCITFFIMTLWMVLFIDIAVSLLHRLLKCCHIGFPCLRSTNTFCYLLFDIVCISSVSLNIFGSKFMFPINLCSSRNNVLDGSLFDGGSALIRHVQRGSMFCLYVMRIVAFEKTCLCYKIVSINNVPGFCVLLVSWTDSE